MIFDIKRHKSCMPVTPRSDDFFGASFICPGSFSCLSTMVSVIPCGCCTAEAVAKLIGICRCNE